VLLSAGYFSPWYQYPYAWGFYYDPFPSWYSTFYYPPFYFTYNWGWYGSCGYWYPGYWPGYRWCDPYYYHYAHAHHGNWVPVPHSQYASRWEPGHGLGNHRGSPGQRTAASNLRRGVLSSSASHGVRAPQLQGRSNSTRLHVRNPGSGGVPVSAPLVRGRSGAPAVTPSSGVRYSLPQSGTRGGAPAFVPRSDGASRGGAPAQAPHYSPSSGWGGLRSAPSMHVPSAAAPRGGAPSGSAGGGHVRLR